MQYGNMIEAKEPGNIIVAIIQQDVTQTPKLISLREFPYEAAALEFVNEQAREWFMRNHELAQRGSGYFIVDGLPEGTVDDETFDELMSELYLTANNGENSFLAAVDIRYIVTRL